MCESKSKETALYLFIPGTGCRSAGLGLISKGELMSWLGFLALIWGLRLNPPSSLDLTLRRKGARGRSKPEPDPLFRVQGFLIADSWESQGNPPSTPAPVIRPSTCQSRRTAMTSSRWHGLRPLCLLCCLDVSEAGKHPSGYGISVSSGMLSLATAAQIDDGRGTTCLRGSTRAGFLFFVARKTCNFGLVGENRDKIYECVQCEVHRTTSVRSL